MAAAISYYTIFAMPPLLGLLALAAGLFVDPGSVREAVSTQVEQVVGVESAAQIVDIVQEATRPDFSGPTAIVGLLALLFGATGAFLHLQHALNRAWSVAPDPERSSVRTFLVKRAISVLMLAATGVVILVSMLLSTGLSLFEDVIQRHAPTWLGPWTLTLADWATSFMLMGALFALILKYVPDAVVRWRDALVGAAFTAVLFTVGKQVIGYYLGRSDVQNVYGAAGSLAVALLWVYYSAIIVLLGAEFTEVWATRKGESVMPQAGAVRVTRSVEARLE
jgi:membrane protein